MFDVIAPTGPYYDVESLENFVRVVWTVLEKIEKVPNRLFFVRSWTNLLAMFSDLSDTKIGKLKDRVRVNDKERAHKFFMPNRKPKLEVFQTSSL